MSRRIKRDQRSPSISTEALSGQAERRLGGGDFLCTIEGSFFTCNSQVRLADCGSPEGKRSLDTFFYRNILWAHGTSGYNFRCVQRGRRAAAPRDSQLLGVAGEAGGRDRGCFGDGAALRFEAFAGVEGCRVGACAA